MGLETAVDNYLTANGFARTDYYWEYGEIVCPDIIDACDVRDALSRPGTPVLSGVDIVSSDKKQEHRVIFRSAYHG